MKNGIIVFLMLFGLFSCGQEEIDKLHNENEKLSQEVSSLQEKLQPCAQNQVKMGMLSQRLAAMNADIITNMGTITVKFFPEKAPLHVMNFVLLSEGGFYNGVKFHRVIKNFMIQSGDPNSKDNNPYDDGTGGSILQLPAEFNDIHHARGILSMARSSNPHSASSQFFIMHADNSGLDKNYTAFGQVVKGMDVVDKIANLKTIQNNRIKDRPVKDVIIKKIHVYIKNK